MTKPGQEGPAQSPPPPWREESNVLPELSPGPEGPDIADLSLEKKRPELPWRKKGEERVGETQRRSEQPLVSGCGSVLEQEGAAAGGSLAELWDACDAPTGQGGPVQGRWVRWRAGGTRGHNLFGQKRKWLYNCLWRRRPASCSKCQPARLRLSDHQSVLWTLHHRDASPTLHHREASPMLHHRDLTWHQAPVHSCPQETVCPPPTPKCHPGPEVEESLKEWLGTPERLY